MTREEYLNALRVALSPLNANDKDEICADFQEHFEIGLSQGKTEHEISAELGSPKTVANTYLSETIEVTSRHKSKQDGQNAVQLAVVQSSNTKNGQVKDLTGARVFVILFNVLLMIWVALAAYASILAGWVAAVGLVSLGISLLTSLSILPAILMNATVFIVIALFCFGLTTGIISFFLTRLSIWVTKAYVNWNKKIYNQGF